MFRLLGVCSREPKITENMSSVTNKSENLPEDPRPNPLVFGLPPSVFPGLFMLRFGITRSFSRQMAHPSFEDLELRVFCKWYCGNARAGS